MATALTDLLIELSDPLRYADFQRDPDAFLANSELNAEERSAFLSRELSKIRRCAKSIESDDPNQQFNRFTNPALLVDMPEFVHDPAEVELDHNPSGQDAVHGRGALYVDQNGTYYRAVRDA